jgi:hypothetical protein
LKLRTRAAFSRFSLGLSLAAGLIMCIPAHASLTFNATFDPTIAAVSGAEGAINAALANIAANITSPNNITVSIYFNTMAGGLGESLTTIYAPSYFQYYTAFDAVSTQPDQLIALASLGTAPGPSSGNPVNGNTTVDITSAEGRNLGFTTPGGVTVNSVNYDSEISLNTSITSPPNSLSGNYGLESVAEHEIDESLGIGGTGSTLSGSGSLTAPVGDLDLYRYSCNVAVVANTCASPVRSYVNTQTTSPLSYFSLNGGTTVLTYFNQTTGADFADWLSNPIPAGFGVQTQDAFGQPGTNPTLGPNELAAFNAIGYDLVAPEPSTFALVGTALLAAGFLRRRRQARKSR